MLNRNAKCSCDYGAICDACVGPFHSFSVVLSVSSCFCCCSCSSSGRIHFIFSVVVVVLYALAACLYTFCFHFYFLCLCVFIFCLVRLFPYSPSALLPSSCGKILETLVPLYVGVLLFRLSSSNASLHSSQCGLHELYTYLYSYICTLYISMLLLRVLPDCINNNTSIKLTGNPLTHDLGEKSITFLPCLLYLHRDHLINRINFSFYCKHLILRTVYELVII